MKLRFVTGLAALALSACTLDEHVIDAALVDPARVEVETSARHRVLDTGREPATATVDKVTATRTRAGAIEVEGHTVVASDGEVSRVQTLEHASTDGSLVLPVCIRYTRGSCRRAFLVTPMDNVRLLREYDRPLRVIGLLELALAGAAIGWGASLATSSPTTSGGGLLIASGSVLAIIGAFQTFGGRKHVSTLVEREREMANVRVRATR